MKIVVCCLSLNSLGGAERLCIHFLKALERKDYDVTLATLDKTDWAFLKRFFIVPPRSLKEFYLFNKIPELPTLTLRQAFPAALHALELLLIRLRGGYDVLVNMRGEIVDSFGDIVYFNAMPLKLMYAYPQIRPTHDAKWKVYARLFSLLTRFFRNPHATFIANSMFNRQIIERYEGKKALIVNPPVELREFQLKVEERERQNLVVTVSRIRLAKGLELIPEIAKMVDDCKFVLIGTSDKSSRQCLRLISGKIQQLRVHEKVEVFENESTEFVLGKLAAAKVFLHTQPTEAFGMAIVEAMAAGCVPVVPRYGGPWIDILGCRDGQYGLSYGSTREAAQEITRLIENDNIRMEISSRARKRATAFDSQVFERKMLRIVRGCHRQLLIQSAGDRSEGVSN